MIATFPRHYIFSSLLIPLHVFYCVSTQKVNFKNKPTVINQIPSYLEDNSFVLTI